MRPGVFTLLALAALAIFFANCSGPVIQLPTPDGSQSGLQAEPPPDTPPQPALLEQRLIILEWPQKVREKDNALILLTIAVDERGNLTATAQSSEGRIEPVPFDIPNIYDTHNIVAVARLDMAGVEAYREAVREPLRPGREVTFRWSIRANEAGVYRGVVWLHLELVPKSGGPIEQQLMMARTIDVETVTVFGMSGELARVLGALGLVAGTVLGYPFIQNRIENWLKRWKKGPPKSPSGTGETSKSGEVDDPAI